MRTWKTPCRTVMVRATGRSVTRVSVVEVARAVPARPGRTGPAKLREGEPAIDRRVRSWRRDPAKPPSTLDEADARAAARNAGRAERWGDVDRFVGDRRRHATGRDGGGRGGLVSDNRGDRAEPPGASP